MDGSDGRLVSIITPFFNAGRFLSEAIESVLAQTYSYWELLLIDDGSNDESTRIARSYAAKYPEQIFYLEHEGHLNRGVCASRNLGVRRARGEFVALLDSDDVWLPRKLEEQISIMRANPQVGMVAGRSLYWHSWAGDAENSARDYVPAYRIALDASFDPPALLTTLYPLGKEHAPCPSDLLLRKEAIESVGGFEERFDGPYQLYEDQAFLTKIYLTWPVYLSSRTWTKYRVHDASCMARARLKYHEIRLFYLSWCQDYLIARGVEDPNIWSALREAMSEGEGAQKERSPGVKEFAKSVARALLPVGARRWIKLHLLGKSDDVPPLGSVNLGDLRRTEPIDESFGFGRGRPVDRYYIENFLAQHAADIKGRVLEIGDNAYTVRYGGSRVAQSDILHVSDANPRATIVGDLTSADHIPSDAFDCIILTQTLHLIYDMRAAVKTLYRILKPGGVLLATFPGISRIDRYEWKSSWYWSLTTLSAEKLFEGIFSAERLEVCSYGNVLAATAFLYGLAEEELRREELEAYDPHYPVIVAVRAVK
jgi:glycosyltransferase involved in cell wall biosynthesis/SAM-dependent methyltransferase